MRTTAVLLAVSLIALGAAFALPEAAALSDPCGTGIVDHNCTTGSGQPCTYAVLAVCLVTGE